MDITYIRSYKIQKNPAQPTPKIKMRIAVHEHDSRARRLDIAPAFRYETLLEDGIDGQPPATPEKRFPISCNLLIFCHSTLNE